MIFDEIRQVMIGILRPYADSVQKMTASQKLLVNCDLMGRVRLIVPSRAKNDTELEKIVEIIAQKISEQLKPHTFDADRVILYEDDTDAVINDAPTSKLLSDDLDTHYDALKNVWLVDRLIVGGNWAKITDETSSSPRIVFFSIKGGVGRSSSLAATAYHFAQLGKKVMVLDLDLESPGLSSALLPEERRPEFGITDWLVEDLVDNGNEVLDEMVGYSTLSRDGDIWVIPAYGRKNERYVAKLGRVWMPKDEQAWSERLRRLIDQLEDRLKPDLILIDSRAGIDEVASACVTSLGANLVLLFASDSAQTWNGYKLLFSFWRDAIDVAKIREKLQMVAALVPVNNRDQYYSSFIDQSSALFTEFFYDQMDAGEIDGWNFDLNSADAPHYPAKILWHQGWSSLSSLHEKLVDADDSELKLIFGQIFEFLSPYLDEKGQQHV
ncbi:MAG: ArsA-related P-loop ATPase [Candidatus Symbiobacter sp.]|nr:ArsA-related P-loop ATPase [Candidatus Symbiobacter sp.]